MGPRVWLWLVPVFTGIDEAPALCQGILWANTMELRHSPCWGEGWGVPEGTFEEVTLS